MPRLGSAIPLVARTAELGRLCAALDRASTKAAEAVLVAGDAGVGKSRLLIEFVRVAREQNAYVLTGRCIGAGEAGLPYLPFLDVVEQLDDVLPDLFQRRPALAALSPTRPELPAAAPADNPVAQLQLFDAVLSTLDELAERAPVVLAVEDLHWSDASTRDLLAFILSRLGSQRLLVVATYRSDDLPRRHPLRPMLAEIVRLRAVQRLDLAPFDAAAARAFVRVLADDDIDADVVADVAARSEGNAFFAEELLAAGPAAPGAMPAELADLLLSRVEQLSSVAQLVVRAVSVTSRRQARHSTLRAVLQIDDDELESALRELVQHYVLVPGDESQESYAFRHALMREAVYADLLPGERVRLHAAYAQLLGDDGRSGLAAARAYHSLRSNDLPGALAASVQAANEAMAMGALGAELRHVEQALELWDAVDDPEASQADELGLLRKACYVAAAAGQPERALSYGRAAVPVADRSADPVIKAVVRRQLAQVMLANARSAEARQTIDEAWQLVRDLPASKERAWVLAVMARVTDDYAELRAVSSAAAADAKISGTASAEADALISLALCDFHDGHDEQSSDLLAQAVARSAEAQAYDTELRARFNLTVSRFEQGRLDLAVHAADEGAARAAELGLTWSPYGLQLQWMRAMVHYARGDWETAAAAAAPPGEDVSDTVTALLAASRALVEVGRGNWAEAERILARVRREWHRDTQIAQLAAIAGAELACWQRRPRDAVVVVSEALAVMRTEGPWPMGGIRVATLGLAAEADLAQVARLQGDQPTATEVVDGGERLATTAERTAAEGTPRTGDLGPEGRAWLARARAERARLHGKPDTAAWRRVVEAFGYGDPYQQAVSRWRLAEALTELGDRDAATEQLSTALHSAEHLGAQPLAQSVRDLATRAGLALPGVAMPATEGLTAREGTVLGMVARGLTNRQIGEELYISDKTVSVHVSRLMAKLGAASRTEAVAIGYQRGLLEPEPESSSPIRPVGQVSPPSR